MKEIKLTQEQVALVDDEDFEWLSQWKWFAHYDWRGKCFYACRLENQRAVYMARAIMKCLDDLIVDHKNHNTLNNQKHNLRTCTNAQNQQNQRKSKGCSSKYKGVSKHKKYQNWVAYLYTRDIFDQRIRMHLGCFKNEEEAALAYDKAASFEFGKFAYLNFP